MTAAVERGRLVEEAARVPYSPSTHTATWEGAQQRGKHQGVEWVHGQCHYASLEEGAYARLFSSCIGYPPILPSSPNVFVDLDLLLLASTLPPQTLHHLQQQLRQLALVQQLQVHLHRPPVQLRVLLSYQAQQGVR